VLQVSILPPDIPPQRDPSDRTVLNILADEERLYLRVDVAGVGRTGCINIDDGL